jgi:heme exporter protein D
LPDNAIYYQWAYGLTLLLYAGYAVTLVLRRRAIARRARAAATGR